MVLLSSDAGGSAMHFRVNFSSPSQANFHARAGFYACFLVLRREWDPRIMSAENDDSVTLVLSVAG